jgi:hypothetical protein
MGLHSVEALVVIYHFCWCNAATKKKSYSLKEKTILKEWFGSEVVISRIWVATVVCKLISYSIDWKSSIDPAKDLIVGGEFLGDMNFQVLFIRNDVSRVVLRRLYLLSVTGRTSTKSSDRLVEEFLTKIKSVLEKKNIRSGLGLLELVIISFF